MEDQSNVNALPIAYSPFKMDSPDPLERTWAFVSLTYQLCMTEGLDLYMAICDCPTSQKAGGIFIMADSQECRCMFCGKIIPGKRIPSHEEALNAWLKEKTTSERKFSPPTEAGVQVIGGWS